MSVPKYERKEGKLEVLDSSRKLINHTITIIKNEKYFPKRDRWIITKPIIDEALSLVINIKKANSVFVTTDVDYKLRRKYQVEANANLSALYTLIELAYTQLKLPSEKVEYWTGLCVEVDFKLKAWIKSDKEKYNKWGISY